MVANLHSHHSWWHKILVKIVSLERVLVKPEVRFYSWLRSSHWNNNSLVKNVLSLYLGAQKYASPFVWFKVLKVSNHETVRILISEIIAPIVWANRKLSNSKVETVHQKKIVFFVIRKFHKNVLRSNRGKFKVNAPILHFIFHISVCMHYTDKVEVRFISPNFRKQY